MSATSTISVYFLDAYHAGDPTFVSRLARHIRSSQEPALLLADPEDRVLLAHEEDPSTALSSGIDPGDARSPMERLLAGEAVVDRVRRSVLDSIRGVVAVFTEEQVPAVGIHGSDRGLLVREPDGRVRCGDWEWIRDLAVDGAVPVISPLATSSQRDVLSYLEPIKVLCAINIQVLHPYDRLMLFRRESAVAPVVELGREGVVSALRGRAEPVVLGLVDLRREAAK